MGLLSSILGLSSGNQGNTIYQSKEFRSENWDQLSDSQKIDLLQRFENARAREIGLDHPLQIRKEYDNSLYGSYNRERITINLKNCDNPYEAMDTIVHETNHAYQQQCIDNGTGYSEGQLAVMKPQFTSSYYPSGSQYDAQTIEVDSNNVGADYVLEHSQEFQDDPDYYEYLARRNEHFEDVNGLLQDRSGYCDGTESSQVWDSYSRGEMTEEERDQALDYISDGNSIRDRSVEVGDAVSQAHADHSLDYSGILHERYENCIYHGQGSVKEANSIIEDNTRCIKGLEVKRDQLDQQLAEVKATQNDYIMSNNMGFQEVENDPYCQQLRSEIEELEASRHDHDYHITELTADSQQLSEAYGVELPDGQDHLLSGDMAERAASEISEENDIDLGDDIDLDAASKMSEENDIDLGDDMELDIDSGMSEENDIDLGDDMEFDTDSRMSEENDIDLGDDMELDMDSGMSEGAEVDLSDDAWIDTSSDLQEGTEIDLDARADIGDSLDFGNSMDSSFDKGDSIELGDSIDMGSSVDVGASLDIGSSVDVGEGQGM